MCGYLLILTGSATEASLEQRENDELEARNFDPEEIKERQAELAKVKALLFYEQMKRHRINKIKSKNLMWAYSLRRICNEAGEYICDDDCESLGRCPTFYDSALNFVDTNCYCFRREYLVTVAHHFYGGWGADRPFYKATSTALPSFGCTGEATVNYRAPERLHQMFRDGNAAMKKAYGEDLPWRKK
jgi:hypothetical protein